MTKKLNPFYVKDCTLATLATGLKAQSLAELRDQIYRVPTSSIYLHFWGGRLRTSFEHHQFHNDFSQWSHHALHDDILAERLELLNPMEAESLETLREDLIDIIENRLDEREVVPFSTREEQFYFMDSNIIIFETRHVIKKPQNLIHVIPKMTRNSFFYHFIDSARRTPDGGDDFTAWLKGGDGEYEKLICQLKCVDPYFISLTDLKSIMVEIVNEYFS